MHPFLAKLEKHVPLAIALLYLASGDYAGLVRQIRLIF